MKIYDHKHECRLSITKSSSTKATSISQLSNTSMAKTTGSHNNVMDIMKKKNKWIKELSEEEDEEEKSEETIWIPQRMTQKWIKKGNTKYWWIPCRIWKLQKPIFANAQLEKGARSAFETVKNFWNEKS